MIRVFQDETCDTEPEYMELDFLYEDDHFLIVNKPAGMDTHPNEPSQTGTLANGVASHFQMNGIARKIRHIHRLDRDTSGAVVFAKHALSHAVLDRLLEERKVKRTYTAVVQGEVKQKKAVSIIQSEKTGTTRPAGEFQRAGSPLSLILNAKDITRNMMSLCLSSSLIQAEHTRFVFMSVT